MTKAGKKLIDAATEARNSLDALIAEQRAMEEAIRTGEFYLVEVAPGQAVPIRRVH